MPSPKDITYGALETAAAASENQALIDVAQDAVGPKVTTVVPGEAYFSDDAGTRQIDTEALLNVPRRQRGAIALHRSASLSQYVNRQKTPGTQLAEHIETSLLEIISPTAADMLELAQSFHATKSAIFKSDQRLATGQVQVRYEETIAAQAGRNQDMEIPAIFILSLAPFEGSPEYELTARLRFRLADGSLRIGYQLDRPDELIRVAFGDILASIEAETSITAMHGQPRTCASA